MKKILTILITLLCGLGVGARAECEYRDDIRVFAVIFNVLEEYNPDFESDGLYYNIMSEENAEVRVMPPVKIAVAPGHLDCEDLPGDWDYRDQLPAEGFYSGDIVIPEKVEYNGKEYSVVVMAPYTFANCVNLTSVKLPETLREIQNAAFDGCVKLKDFDLPKALTTIRIDAIVGCLSLESFDMTYLSYYTDVFGTGQVSIKTLTLSQAEDAWFSCHLPASVEKIIQPNENPKFPEKISYYNHDCPELFDTAEVFVPAGCEEAYRADSYWGQFKNIKSIGSSGVGSIAAETSSFSIENGRINLKGEATLEVFNLLGTKVATLNADNSTVRLPAGIFICTSAGKAKKIIVK